MYGTVALWRVGGTKENNNLHHSLWQSRSAHKGQKPFSWVGNIAHKGSALEAFWEFEKGLFKVQDHNPP